MGVEQNYPGALDADIELQSSSVAWEEKTSERFQVNNGKALQILLLVTSALLIAFALGTFRGNRLTSGMGHVLGDVTPAALLYRVHKRRSGRSPFELLANRHPVFTRVLSPWELKGFLGDRQRIRGGAVKNSLVAACPDISTAMPEAVASWNKIHGIRELVFVDYSNARKTSQESVRLVNSIDKLGRCIHVTGLAQNFSRHIPGRLSRAQALNLGVAISSGENVVIVDCNVIVSSGLLSEHQLNNRTFYTGTPSNDSLGKYTIVYIKRQAFVRVYGFDERIQVPGDEHKDLVNRLKTLPLRRLSMDTQMIRTKTISVEGPVLFGIDMGAFQAEDAVERAKRIPKLSRYISALAIKELPKWHGSSFLLEGRTFGLSGFRFRVLREQIENTQHRSRRRAAFQISYESENRLWILAVQAGVTLPSTLSLLSPTSLNKVVLEAHRKLLHEDYKVPQKVLRFLEQISSSNSSVALTSGELDEDSIRMQQLIVSYSPFLFEVVWRRKQLLMINLEVEHAMDLFIGTSWAIASALSMDRALLLAGHFLNTPVSDLLDYEGTTDIMHREYNLNINLMGGNGNWDCGRGGSEECWAGDVAAAEWDEYNLTREPSNLATNASRHVLFNIVSKQISRWDHDTKATMSYRSLQEKAFASISLSSEVGRRLLNTSQVIRDNLGDTTALWLTHASNETRSSVQIYMEHHASHEGHRPLVFITGNRAEYIEAAYETLPYAEKSSGPHDAYRRTADAWIALQCRNIVFDSIRPPAAWVGADAAILEWRRIHAPESAHYGVSHVQPSNETRAPWFHKLEFYLEPSLGD